MTDLEKHWDDVPVGPAPVDAILREARRSAAAGTRRRPEARLRGSLVAIGAVGGLAAAFVVGGVVLPPDAGPPPGGVPTLADGGAAGADDIAPAAFFGELQAPESCDDLLQHYVDRGTDLVGAYGWGSGYGAYVDVDSAPADGMSRERATGADTALPQAVAPATSRAESSETGTNVQEAGVDEPDAVKTTDDLLVRLKGAVLTTYDLGGRRVRESGSVDLGDLHDAEILLAGDTVVAIGNDGSARPSSRGYDYASYGVPQPPQQTRVVTVDVGDPADPMVVATVDYDAALVAARQHGTDVRLVLSKGLPELDFETDDRRPNSVVAANRRLVEKSTIDDWLPHVAVDGGAEQPLLQCDRVAIPRAELGPATMAVVGFGVDDPGAAAGPDNGALGLAGEASMTYESTDHLYLATGGGGFDECWECFTRTSGPGGSDGTTHVYDFALAGTGATYVGAGEVEGHVRDRWSMDEADGVLRLAVGPSSETENANSVVTLEARDDELVEVGRLDGLGRNEDIKSVRWFDGLAILVTFRRIDPLYAVDLTDVRRPTLLGELKIPGFSSYLHPLGPRRLVGVGSDGGNRAQAALLDLTDVTDPQQLAVHRYVRGTYATAADDPRQFTWLPDRRVVLTVVQQGNTGYVSTLQLGGGRISNRMTRVEFGSDIDLVRTVPLADGRVALVTGEDVSFFDV
ncbi:beta-propeller domain-containing protein [Nocardioides sp. C4-1]|uniref:beta-propeller domain-containing protein n=1 Tax=Nocardioides sp. C4-1 TaxID=3151851 RepID=UPI0032652CCA